MQSESSPRVIENTSVDGVTAEGEALPSAPQCLTYVDVSPPAGSTAVRIAAGVSWCRIPLPIDLNHINVWLLDTPHGYVLVDTGMASDVAKQTWEDIAVELFSKTPLYAVFVTHIHPDHFGLAAWLQQRHGVQVWMSRRTYEQAQQLLEGRYLADPEGAERFFRSNGIDDVTALKPMFSAGRFARMASGLPQVQRFIADADVIEPGLEWRAIATEGHAEGHLCLRNAQAQLLISGDQVLPTISSNISFSWRSTDPNPLSSFLSSLRQLRELPSQTLVLPSHGLPFRGLQQRVDDLLRHHESQLAKVSSACETPCTARDVLPLLFRRQLVGMHLFLALGEALAHLEYLVHAGRLRKSIAEDGVTRYAQT